MSNHLEWGHSSNALYGLVSHKDAFDVLGHDIDEPFALYVTTGDGDGVVIEGPDLVQFCADLHNHVARQSHI